MAFIPVPAVARVEILFTRDNQIVENVFHYKFTSVPVVADLSALASALDTIITANWLGSLPGNCSYTGIRVTALDTATAPQFFLAKSPTVPGVASGASLPNNVTIAVKLLTSLRGRSFRGRIYWPGLSSGMVSSDNILSASLTTMLAAVTAMLGPVPSSGNTARMTVVSYITNRVHRSTGLDSQVVTVTSTDSVLDSMRNRLPNHKRRRTPRP